MRGLKKGYKSQETTFLFLIEIYFNWRLITLQYCIGFAIHQQNLPQVYMCSPSWTPLPPPSPYHSSGLSQCTSPKHPVLCIEPGLVISFIYDIIHVSMPFFLFYFYCFLLSAWFGIYFSVSVFLRWKFSFFSWGT